MEEQIQFSSIWDGRIGLPQVETKSRISGDIGRLLEPHHSAVNNLTAERLVRLFVDPGPSFQKALAGAASDLAWSTPVSAFGLWYHLVVVLGLALSSLAGLWTDRPASRLTNIKGGPTIVVSSPSSSHSISYFAIQPSQSSIITSLSTLLPSNTMSSSANQSYYSPYAPSSTDYRSPPTHRYSLRPPVPAMRGNGGRPALRSTRAVANAPVARRNGPNRRPALARHNNRRGPARGNRRAPAVSPAISAVCGKNSGGLRSNHYVLTPRRNEPTFYRTPYQTPHRRGHHQPPPSPTWSYVQRRMAPFPNRPPSPTWADVLRNPAPNRDSPLFCFEVPDTPGLRMPMDIPEPEAPPFLIGQAALDDIFKYLQGNDAAAEPGPEPEAQPAPMVLDEDPAGFEPSHTADDWANRGTSISSGSSDSGTSRPSTADTTALNSYHNIQFHLLNEEQVHFLLEDQTRISHYNVDRFQTINNKNKYLFVAIGFINYCLRHPSSNRVIQNDRVIFFRCLMYLRL
ncbi:hypothetical protein PSTG_13699 [Puccinia striiformis f. sp. tritici PST-78]|uniref:Uncharacterized protein n=1 Tax=Puccinia striiformis f. sp. tritici PST-78 TaxID=1165861 RepID=A0A0L0V123_9BASI|nr:hypothetical protein PSTG_13699 [Puccinia striiformis f. sp. tritici PST-78]